MVNKPKHSPIIKNCHFTFKCPIEWEKLELIPDKSNIRHCSSCNKNVHLTTEEHMLVLSIFSEYCVAVPIELIRQMPTLDADIAEFNLRDPKNRTHLIGAISSKRSNEDPSKTT